MFYLWDLGFSTCFCGDGNPSGSLIKCDLSRKLLFQSSIFSILVPLGLMSLCDRSLRERYRDGVPVQPAFDPSCLFCMYVICLFLIF